MKIIVMVYFFLKTFSFLKQTFAILDYYNPTARGRPPSASGTPGYDMQGIVNSISQSHLIRISFSW